VLLNGVEVVAGDPVGVSAPEMTKSRDGGRALLVVLFLVYLVLLVWIVLWKLDVPWVGAGAQRQIKLVPFVRTADAGPTAPFDLIANIALFIPFGLYLGLLAPSWRWWNVAGVLVGASVALEVAQYVLAVGRSDITDVIVNTAGGLAGLGLVVMARRRYEAKTAAVMTRVCLVGTVIAVVAVGVFVALPLRYASPRDAAVSAVPDRIAVRTSVGLTGFEPATP
jgi:glycopeptide antibiotics resistance protein